MNIAAAIPYTQSKEREREGLEFRSLLRRYRLKAYGNARDRFPPARSVRRSSPVVFGLDSKSYRPSRRERERERKDRKP